jgi:serine/threonine protein kinase
MSTSERQLLQSLFDSVVTLAGKEQEAFLHQTCADHPSLCDELKRLVVASNSSGGVFDKYALDVFERNLEAETETLGETLKNHAEEGRLVSGTVLGERYEIKKFLAQGGIGAAYLAIDRRLSDSRSEKTVVIKVLLEESLSDQYLRRKFEHEKKALARIQHRSVVGLLDMGETPDGNSYFVMQYVPGEDLGAKIDHAGMDFQRAANILRQVGQALTAAHNQGVLHRDLKPSNIRLTPNDDGIEEVTLIDFGIAQISDATDVTGTQTRHSLIVGSPAYMSPEQFGREVLTAASDIYSMGVLAYEMLTGRKPFHAIEAERDRPRFLPREVRPEISETAQSAILRALAIDPAQRHDSARAFGDELAIALTDAPVLTPPDPTQGLPKTPRNRSRLLLVGALVVLLLASVVGALIFLSPDRGSPEVAAPASERTLNYWIEVQKYRDRKAYEEPFRLAGESVIFERDYRIRLHLSSPQAGYLYIINEGPVANGETQKYVVIFPVPSQAEGSAQISENQSVVVPEKSPIVFDQEKGTEKLWLIFSARSVPEFEAVKGALNKKDGGLITDPTQVNAVREFISRHEKPTPQSIVNDEARQTIIRGTGDLLISLRKFEHH